MARIGPPKVPRLAIDQNPRIRRARQTPATTRPIHASPRFRQNSLKPITTVPNGPLSPHAILATYRNSLTNYEAKEIIYFPEIYYLGIRSQKSEGSFDDEESNLRLAVGDHLAYRFEVLSLLGAGSFGEVVRCRDHKTHSIVATKVIVNTEQMHEQGQIEAQILAMLNRQNSQFIVKAHDFFVFRGHICITYECLGPNLYEVAERNNFASFPISEVRIYATQILKALAVVHGAGIIHADLKPENVLIAANARLAVKLIDFGSSCAIGGQKYEYIQSRFYRAPEVIMVIPYGPPMDMWSFALIIIELINGTPLFPGEDEVDQISRIAEMFGEPPEEMVKVSQHPTLFDEEGKIHGITRKPGTVALSQFVPNDPLLLDFLEKILVWDPEKRLTAPEALRHPWIASRNVRINVNKKGLLPSL